LCEEFLSRVQNFWSRDVSNIHKMGVTLYPFLSFPPFPFPPLLFLVPSPSFPFSSLLSLYPIPIALRSRLPLIQLGDVGERSISSPSGSGQIPAPKRCLVHFELKNASVKSNFKYIFTQKILKKLTN